MEKTRAAQITAKALRTRKQYLGADSHLPICPYVLCEAMGFDLRFVKINSFEGMYVANQNLILISAERPEGRKRFTCAHEIGHHVLGHGTVIDEILKCGSSNIEEEEADFFASILLMPSSAVKRIMLRTGISTATISSTDAYILSKYFGVSYQSFLLQLYFNLGLISYIKYQELKIRTLPEIRLSISGLKIKGQVLSIGAWWDEKAIELEVGDYIVSEKELLIDGPKIVQPLDDGNDHCYLATKPGITRVFSNGWDCFVKISRYKFHGIYQFKFDEDEE